ncbi:MAG: hypothetical protein HC847_23810 [Hydrococcus sp. RU_2_2]|nr:hypothetical protein [Hydrococcus sp. RU_2_2]NJP22008.1 hypothetical protein [Hydrococcus sp. CRU_1_1]
MEENLKKTLEEVAKTEYLLRRLQDKTNMQSSLLVNDFVAITFLERIDFKRTQKQVEEKVGFPLDCWGSEQIKEDLIESYLLEVLTPIAKSIYEEACQAVLFS